MTLAGLAMLGGALPLTAGGVHTYAAVFRPESTVREAVASLSEAGNGWRVMRVLASRPVPILILAHGKGNDAWPRALLLPVPYGVVCSFSSAGL